MPSRAVGCPPRLRPPTRPPTRPRRRGRGPLPRQHLHRVHRRPPHSQDPGLAGGIEGPGGAGAPGRHRLARGDGPEGPAFREEEDAAIEERVGAVPEVPGSRATRREVAGGPGRPRPFRVSETRSWALCGVLVAVRRGVPLTWRGASSSALVSRSRAMPTGGRRSKPSSRLFPVGDRSFAAFGRDAGQFSRWGPEDRRSLLSPRFPFSYAGTGSMRSALRAWFSRIQSQVRASPSSREVSGVQPRPRIRSVSML